MIGKGVSGQLSTSQREIERLAKQPMRQFYGQVGSSMMADPTFTKELHQNYRSNIITKKDGWFPVKLPSLADMKLQSIPNTQRVCRLCRGERIVFIKHSEGSVSQDRCPHCKGSGVMFS